MAEMESVGGDPAASSTVIRSYLGNLIPATTGDEETAHPPGDGPPSHWQVVSKELGHRLAGRSAIHGNWRAHPQGTGPLVLAADGR
jgi:hypothetical protein